MPPDPSSCEGPNPQGCFESGCPIGQVCRDLGNCIPSGCGCDEATGGWWCTDDCGGGECVPDDEPQCAGPNPQGCHATGCPDGQICEVHENDCVPSQCGCDPESGIWICTEDCGGGVCRPAAGALRWYLTCGDPVCRGHSPEPDLPRCEDAVQIGAACDAAGTRCDPVNECNARVICADSDPREAPGGCPVSKAEFKRDIRTVTSEERARLAQAAEALPLATWRYRADPSGTTHLGFIIEDGVEPLALRSSGDQVDLYGYTTLAVAAVQTHRAELRALEQRLAALEARLVACEAR